MTLKRKNEETGQVETREVAFKDLLLGTPTWRMIIIGLILSMHPIGRQLLGTFGFEFPDQRKLTVAADEAKSSKAEIAQIATTVNEIKLDLVALKVNNANLNTKVENLDQTFQGFKIDFNKWKATNRPEP